MRMRVEPGGPLRIVVVTTSYPLEPGSISGIFIDRLLRALPADLRATVVTPGATGRQTPVSGGAIDVRPVTYAPRAWQQLAHNPGGIPVALRARPWLWPLVPAMVAALFLGSLRALRRADLAHANWSACGVIAGIAGACLRRPVVTSLRGEDVSRLESSRLSRWTLRLCALLSDRLVVVSGHMLPVLSRLLGSASSRAVFIPNGVDPELLELPIRDGCPAPGARRRILSVGALIPRKRMDLLVSALGEGDAGDEVVLVGDGVERERLRELAGRLGVEARLRMEGSVEPGAMVRAYAAADVFVLASAAEGRPNVVIEAMAAGLPVIATDIPGIREIVVHGKTGLLFNPADPADLCRRLQELRDTPGLGERLARTARKWIADEGLTWPASAGRYAELYREMVAERRRVGA